MAALLDISERPIMGVWVDALTPLTSRLDIDLARLESHLRTLAAKDVKHCVLFGQAGEGASFSSLEKIDTLKYLLEQGFDPNSFLLGIGTSAVPEAATLIQTAHDLGVRRFLVAPPVHTYPVQQSGMSRYFSGLIEKVDRPDWCLYLHLLGHPGPSEISDAALAEIVRTNPPHVSGLVDQGLSPSRTLDYIKSFGETISVSSCQEDQLSILRPLGVISIQANLIPRVVKHVLETDNPTKPSSQIAGLKIQKIDERVQALAAVLGDMPAVSGYKYLLSLFYRQPDWQLTRAPYSPLEKVKLDQLEKAFRKFQLQPDE